MANPLLTDEQNRRLANQNSTYNQIMQGFAPVQQPQEDSWLGGLSRGAKAGLGGVGAGLLHAGQAAFGTDGSLAAGFDAMAKNNAQRREWDLADTLSLDYLTNPEGLAYGLGQIAGSMALPALFGAGVAAAVPTGGTSLLGTGALIGAAGAAPMAISEGGNTYAQGLQQGMTEDEAKKAGLTDAAIKLPFYMLSEGLSGKVAQGLISKGLLNAEGKSLGRRAAESGAKILGNAANEAYEEGTENRSSAYALGDQRISSLGNIFNPFDWNEEDKAQAVGVFTPTLALGALTGGAGHLRSRFDKKNSDVAEEIASEDGGTIEEAPNEENFWENKEAAKHSIQQAYADGLISKDDARVMLMKINDEELGEADKKRLKAREKQVAAAIESRRIQGYNDELDNYVNNRESGKEAFINAIAGQESGGDYGAVNGRTGASGKYQIMPENWPAWAEEAGLGADAEMTPENQEIVARYKLGEYYDKYGARGAAMAWYAGEGSLNYSEEALNRKQGNGDEPSINEYADSVLARMGNYADNARIDDTEENYFDESDYMGLPKLSAPTAKGFDVSHLIDEEAQDSRELFGEKQDENIGKQNLGNDFFSNIKVEQDKRAKAIKDIARAVSQPNTFDELRNSIPSNYLEQMQKARAVVPVNNNAVGRPIPSQTGTALTMQRGRNGGLNTDELAIMQKYQGNPDAFNRQFKKSVETVRDAVNRGDITPDVGRAYMQNLGNMYNTVAGTVQNDGVILQGQDPAIIKMLGNLRDKRRRGDTGVLPSLLQENGNADRSAAFANRNNPLAPLNLPVKTPKGWDKAEAEYKARAEEKAEKHTRQQTIADIVNARAAQKWDEAETEYVSSKKGIDVTLPKGVTVDAKFVKNQKTGKKEVELKFSGEKISDEFKKKLRAHGFNWNVGRKAWVAEENIITKAVAEQLTQKENVKAKEGNQTEKIAEPAQDKADSVQTKRAQAKQAIEDAPKGKTVEATTDNGVKFGVQYAIVPADSLITSNNASDFSNNEAYPQELQPRDRNRAYMRLQVEKMSGTIEPERITTGTSVNEGAPIVNKEGVVENGNGRTMALARMWRSGNKKLQKTYRDYLAKNAVKFGLLSSSLKGIDNPILVRIRTDNNVSVSEVTDSTKGGAQLSTAEQALQDSKKLKDSTLAKYEQNRLGTIDNAKNAEFVRAVFKDIIPEDELNAYTTTDGSLSKSGRQRAVNAILAKAYGADPVLFNLVESTDEAYGKIGDALIAAAPTIAKLKALASNQTLFEVDLAGEILKAIKFVSNAKANNMAVFDAVSQQSMFADYNVDELTKKLALFIDNNKGAKWKNIVDMVTVSADVIAKKGSPLQGNVFGEEVKAPTAEEVLTTAINRVTNGEATAIIRMNDEKGQIEIKFVGNVSESVKKKLAKAKFKLSLEEQMWHADRNAASMKVAKELGYEEQGGNNGSISIFDEEAQAERNAGETASTESNETEEKQPAESNQDEVKETAEQATKKSFFSKRNEQAGKEQRAQSKAETEQGEKLNLPKGTTVDVSIVGDNSNIIQVKFNGEQGKGTSGIMGRAGYKWKNDKQVWQARKTEKAMDVAEQLGYKPAEEMSEDKSQQIDKYKNYSKEDIKINKERLATMPDVDGILQPAAKKFAEFFKAHFPKSDYTYETVDFWNNYILEFEQLNKILKKYRQATQQGDLSAADAYFQQISSSLDRLNNLLGKLVGKDKEEQQAQMRQEFRDSIIPFFDEYNKIADKHNAKEDAKKASKAKKQQNQGKQEYKYYLNARPADVGTVPKGFIRVDTEDKGGRYGAIYYDRQLNDTDVQQYELKSADDVEKEKAQKEALETVSKELLKSDKLKAQAKNNSIGDFVLAYRDAVDDYLAEHVDENPAYTKLLNNPEIADEFLESESIIEKAYDKLKASDNSQDVVQSNKGNTNEGGNNNGIDITGKLSSNDTGSRRSKNEIRTTSSSEESSGSNGQGSRTLEGQSGRNGNNGVPGSRTAVGGKTSISKGSEQVSAVRENPARSAELSGSVVDSLQEQPNVDEGSIDKIVESVADGRTDAADTVNQKVNEVVKENNLDRQRADRLRKTAKVMPFLSKIQFSNTDFVADRLADNGKQGVMITDGTGTGKTFSGLAVAKEMVEDGKENILIVTPSDSVNNQWANAAKDFFGIELSKLDNIQDAGKGAVITTYANLGANDALIKRDWDLVICDESHYLMNNEQGEKTAALAKLRQLTLHPRELRARAEERILPEEKLEARRTIAQAAKLKRKKGQLKASEEAIVEKAEKLQKEKADELSKEERVQVEAQVKDWEQLNTTEKPKVMFMSATPFAYVPDIDYAEGYLFDYPKVEGGSYNQPGNGFQQFMIEHFGYHMRYNKLTKPDKAVDNAVMEVEFHEWLRKTGALTGHELEIDKDYNRGFLLVDQGVGKKIDEGFEFLRNNHDKYRELEGVLNKQFDSRRRNYLLESIKARESVPIIQQYLKAGKKVVVFYETNVERESFNPFKFTQQTKELLQSGENRWTSEEIQHEMDMFAKERPDLVNLNLDELSEPISIYREAFGDDAMFFNGRVSKNKRAEYVKAFNDDNSGKNLIFVQQDAGNAGISLHDTTGKHQRVLINIGIPRRPSYAIQIEGRIYRLGNKSNAIIRYLTTATNIENGLFAETVAGRASTAENLALGRRARGLRDSFKNAYQEIFDGTWEDRSPGIEGEDVGGKENDRNIVSTDSDYDRAKAFYFARGKKTAKNKAAEGVDYFATPEPVGYKMVQWAGLKDGDRVLEPSAGHGAISRFFSPNTDNTIIEPSSRLAPQAQMNTDNAKLINGYFEDLHIGNKYDAVTMNPPFGTGGKTAVEHVAKAFKHLRNGGRVIAIIPRGAMADKRFDAWYESDDAKDAHMVGEVLLPGITFERAGTKVATRIVIIDKGGESQGVKRIDLSRINNINELFDNLESVEMPARQTKQADAGTANFANSLRKGDAEGNSEVVTADSYKHTKTGEIIPSAKLNANLSDEEYRKVKSIAGKNGGYYSRYAKAFLFQDNETGRDKFVEEVNGANNTQYSVTSEAVQRAKEEVEAEIRAAFPNGKVEYVNGVPTITLPNGAKFQYSIRKNLIVNAKEQKKADAAHGTSGARVQGYWKKFTGNGVQRMLAVSQNSERGTAFHEAMHAAADLALTEKEKNALYNYYQKQADKQGRDVNEVMADAYRDWVLARQRKSGTMFGKLWRKVKDFCTRIKAIFDKGAEVERIMQDIESGRVYERGANNHSVTKRIFFSKEEIQGQKGSGTTQVATTRTMYVKALKWLRNQSPEAKTVLDYGAGLGLGTDDMRSNNPDLNIDSYEPNPERWAGKEPPTYTNNTQIDKDYDLILNTNVLNVVEKPIRDLIVKDIADHLNVGGKALITTRGWSNDVNAAKNFKPADEHHAIWINKGKNGYVFQKGFDGDELKNYIEELLGDEFVVEKTRPTFGKSSVTITRVKAQPNTSAKQLELLDMESYQEMPDSYKTLKGSVVKRSKYGVGKQMGSQVYLHKDYVSDVIPKKVWENALKVLSDANSDFEYNCVMYDTKTGNVRFDEAPDFDEAREPIVGDTITVKPDGTVKRGHSNYIWHHKWLWVKNDYQGFDVNQSKAWSNKWLSTLTETADGNGIERWNAQLDRFNLERDGEEIHYSGTESINPNEEYIQGLNDTDADKVNAIAKSFEDKGYVGRPIVVIENGNEGYIALTGSHRIEAAKQADVDLKAIVLENNEDTAQLIEARDDDERENIAKQLYEEGAISKSVYDVIREENESNGTYYSVASPKHKIANAFTNTERKGVVDSVKDFFKEHRKSLYQDWFDKNNPLKGFDALTKATGGLSVYDQVQSLPATTAGMLKALTEGTAQHVKMANQHLKNVKMKYNVTLAMALEKIDKKQMDKAYPKYLAENGFDNWVNALGAYLGAERCLEMARLARAEGKTYKFPKGLTEQECQDFVNKAPQQFKAAADIFYKVNDNVISIMEDAEVFSHDLAKTLRTKYRKYCPLLRDFSDTAAADSFIGGLTEGGRGIGNVSVPLKRINIEGSERGVLNPLETILKSYAVMLNRAERNKVALMAVENSRTADLHELIQEVPGTTADPKNCVFTVLINGKKKAYKTTQDLYGPIVGYNLPAANLAFGVARTAARMLRTGATMSPSFILRNVLRDTVFAGISSKNDFIPIVDTIRGAIALAKDPAMRTEFEAAGVTEYNFYSSQKSRIKSLDAMAGETPASAWEIMKAVFSRLEATSDFFESSTRMGEYMKARQKGLSMEEAARAAREVTLDFSRSGRIGEQVNQVVPFFNACLQGGDKMVRLFRDDFVGTSLKVFKYIVLPSLLIMAMNWDEDWYKDLDPDIKNNYWCVGRNIRIPKPQEAGVLFGSGIEALFQQAADKDKDAVSNFLKAFSSNMMPSVLPTLILPLIEWSANYSFFKGRPLVGNKYSRLPDELQYNDYTSELSKGIGSALKVSPMKIDNLVRGYTGTMGALLWSMAGEPFAKANNLPAKHFSELPFVRDFNVTDANLSRPMNEFYGILDKANRQHAGYGVKGKPEAAVKGIRSAGAMISKIRKDIDKITHSNLTPERKRELIDKRKEKMNQIAKQANARYGKYFD